MGVLLVGTFVTPCLSCCGVIEADVESVSCRRFAFGACRENKAASEY